MRIVVSLLLCLHLLMPSIAWAQVKLKDPSDYSLRTYAWVFAVALLGGFVSWYGKVRRGELPGYSMFHLMGELLTSALAGLLCFWFCEWAAFHPLLTAAFTGVAGHMGTQAITIFEKFMERRLKSGMKP